MALQSLNPGYDGVEGGLNVCGGNGGHNRLLVLLKNLIQILPQKHRSQVREQHEGNCEDGKKETSYEDCNVHNGYSSGRRLPQGKTNVQQTSDKNTLCPQVNASALLPP